MSKPLALDLCCGKGGWTNGLLATDWDVIGVDIKDMGGYQSHLLLADAKTLTVAALDAFQREKFGYVRSFSLVVASPPCQDFSYSSLPFKKARAKFSKDNPPSTEIWKACERIAGELKAPLILENVRGARKWVRKEDWHYGSFYFWGETPALLPTGCPRKGFGAGKNWKDRPMQVADETSNGINSPGNTNARGGLKKSPFATPSESVDAMRQKYKNLSAGRDGFRKIGGAEQAWGHATTLREQWSAKVAMIPQELSEWIGRLFYPSESQSNGPQGQEEGK